MTMTTLTDYLNPDDYPALQSLPFVVFITGKHHVVNEALQRYLGQSRKRYFLTYPFYVNLIRKSIPNCVEWHYSEYESQLRITGEEFVMIAQSLELIHTAFRVFGERMVLIRVDKIDDRCELVIYNHVALNAAIETNWEIRG